MSGRDAILSRIRNAVNASDDEDDPRRVAVSARLDFPPRGVIPARGQLGHDGRIELFSKMAEKAAATVDHAASAADVPALVSAYLRKRNLGARLRMGSDRRLRAIPWVDERTLQVMIGPTEGSDEVTVSHALGAIAETGTLALASGRDNPTTLNLLSEHHIVVVDAADIAGDMETVLDSLREGYGKGHMPRTLNFITGPSRSGDIEQTLLLGAHGPRALHVIVVGGKGG
ncbi:MAG: lactate utilization protein [Rhizobiaceae bacterium]|nr:lactate utilization protein [Rhizobiaceae bacterium]